MQSHKICKIDSKITENMTNDYICSHNEVVLTWAQLQTQIFNQWCGSNLHTMLTCLPLYRLQHFSQWYPTRGITWCGSCPSASSSQRLRPTMSRRNFGWCCDTPSLACPNTLIGSTDTAIDCCCTMKGYVRMELRRRYAITTWKLWLLCSTVHNPIISDNYLYVVVQINLLKFVHPRDQDFGPVCSLFSLE